MNTNKIEQIEFKTEYKPKTIGYESDKLATEYFNLFLKFRVDELDCLRNDPEGMASHDLNIKKLKYEFAIEKLQKMIKEYKDVELTCTNCGFMFKRENHIKCSECGSSEVQ